MKENIEVLARAEAAAKEKSLAFEVEIVKLKEQCAHEAAEREREKEENRRKMQEDLENANIALKEELKQEFLSMLAQQKEATLNQVKFSNNVVLIFQLLYNVVLIIHLFSTMLVYASFLYRCFFMLASCITCSLAWKRMVNLYVLLSSITA
jgi:Flp pilus assembly protein TadB